VQVKQIVKRWVAKKIYERGFHLVPVRQQNEFASDFTREETDIIRTVRPYSMVPNEGIVELRRAVQHLVKQKIEGAIVECGVYRGGCMMAVALTLSELQVKRQLFLFDTFSGMPESTERDRDFLGRGAEASRPMDNKWCYARRDDVEANMCSTSFDMSDVTLVEGMVEETIPEHAPDRIALLRLDTDFYESTYHELVHLYPRIVPGGILIIDDYGYWSGCREAVDQYFREQSLPCFMARTTSSIRTIVKV
jgi:O-methyltransferase